MFGIGGYWNKSDNYYTSQFKNLRIINEGEDEFSLLDLSLKGSLPFRTLCVDIYNEVGNGVLYSTYQFVFKMNTAKFESEIEKINKKVLSETSTVLFDEDIELYILECEDMTPTALGRKLIKSYILFDEDRKIILDFPPFEKFMYAECFDDKMKNKFIKIMKKYGYSHKLVDHQPRLLRYDDFTINDFNKLFG